jgi:hypothetical protein
MRDRPAAYAQVWTKTSNRLESDSTFAHHGSHAQTESALGFILNEGFRPDPFPSFDL